MQTPFFPYIASASFLLPIYSGIRNWKYLGASMKFYAVFSFYAGLHLIIEYILGRMHINNHFLLNIYDLVSFECITYLYYRWIQQRQLKNLLQVIGLLYLLYWVFEVTFIEVPSEFQVTISTASNILLIISSVMIFYIIVRSTEEKIYSLAITWIATGVILYSGGTVIVQSMSNVVLKMGVEYFTTLWYINWTFSIITNLLYARSFWCKTF